MVNQMERYKPDAAAPPAFPRPGTLFLGAVGLALHLVHGRPKAVGGRQLRRKAALCG
mgnify:CR=1 FL=1